EAFRRQYREATHGMSDDALRLSVAQAKLDTALSRHGAHSRQAAAAELELRRVMQGSTVAVHQHSAALAHEERELGRVVRGAVAGSGVFRGLGRSVAFASGA